MEVSRTKTEYMSVNDRVMNVTVKLSIPAIMVWRRWNKQKEAELAMES